MKILFLSYWFPYPPSNGSKIRIYNLLRILAASHEVTLVAFDDEPEIPPEIEALKSICKDVFVVPRKNYNPLSLKSLAGLFSPWPRVFIDIYSAEMANRIQKLVGEENFDIIIASQVGMAVYSDLFRGIPAIFEEVEVGVLYEQYVFSRTIWQRYRNGLTWWKHKNFLQRILKEFDYCTVASEREHFLLSQMIPEYKKIEILPNFVELDDYQGVTEKPEHSMIIFSGSFRYLPNYQGIIWFLEKVQQLLMLEFPELKLYITGDDAGLPLQNSQNVIQTGFIENIYSMISRACLLIVPLQVGGGTRLKIIESLALGTPVVSTSKGAEGLEVTHGKNILIADEPLDFAHAVKSILEDADLRHSLSVEGRKLVSENYNSAVIGRKINALLDRVLEKPTR